MSVTTAAAAQQSSSATSSPASSSTSSSSDPLGSLSSNFNDFLKLLMTQLQNQDPTSPMDTNQFTSELVQFSSVEQQINTNSSLTQLIQLTQAGEVMQSSGMIGKQVAVQSDHIPLQNGTGAIQFQGTAGQQIAVAISDSSGAKIRDATLTATNGANTWTWDGTDNSGRTVPDGSYAITVTQAGASGAATAVPFSVIGTATGVVKQNNNLQLQLGPTAVDFGSVQAVDS
ncbi:MAG: flagellar hook assembly protein FlgD [Acetobacteraceae bacterium]|nr:flagellar hook assembly protein FlgD [Acetobacteraceae bacterium]MBV8525717.1 flagellar hook assembly protein FlgD [Acetobacteraceae bacterium]